MNPERGTFSELAGQPFEVDPLFVGLLELAVGLELGRDPVPAFVMGKGEDSFAAGRPTIGTDCCTKTRKTLSAKG